MGALTTASRRRVVEALRTWSWVTLQEAGSSAVAGSPAALATTAAAPFARFHSVAVSDDPQDTCCSTTELRAPWLRVGAAPPMGSVLLDASLLPHLCRSVVPAVCGAGRVAGTNVRGICGSAARRDVEGDPGREGGVGEEEVERYKEIEVSTAADGRVGVITLSRPKQLNALNEAVMMEFMEALDDFDLDPDVGAVVIIGSGSKAFAAGADIKEMKDRSFVEAYSGSMLAGWEVVNRIKKPLIAAVNGYALGGGCELAMMCDIILAGENALFGQPEVTLGTIPGMGGTQRLTRAVGKYRAMEMILSGACFMDSNEAVARGLAARVIPGGRDNLLHAAVELGDKIARLSKPVVAMAKDAVKAAAETTLQEGCRQERQLFWATFALEDQVEGMSAFVEKRKPAFKNY